MNNGRERLRDWMDRSKVNQSEAAAILGFDRTYLSQILGGKRTPGLTVAVHIERVTGIAIEAWLTSERGQPSTNSAESAISANDGKA